MHRRRRTPLLSGQRIRTPLPSTQPHSRAAMQRTLLECNIKLMFYDTRHCHMNCVAIVFLLKISLNKIYSMFNRQATLAIGSIYRSVSTGVKAIWRPKNSLLIL